MPSQIRALGGARLTSLASVLCAAVAGAGHPAMAQTATDPAALQGQPVAEIVVTASRLNLLGKAMTASQGSVTKQEIDLRPIYRIGQLYRPLHWIEFNTDLAFSKARYTGSPAQLANFGLDGPFITEAPSFIGSFGVLVDNLGPWFGGLQWRAIGP